LAVRIVFLASALLLVGAVLGARVWDVSAGLRDVAELPDQPGDADDGDEQDIDCTLVLPEVAPVLGVDLRPLHVRDRVSDVPRGRAFVSDIFRPPTLSRA
jgi:hypothetical protein